MSLYRYSDITRILRTRRESLAKKSRKWLSDALEALRGELNRRTREYEEHPAKISDEVSSILRENASILRALANYTERKRNALLRWLYYYMRRGNAVERAVLRDKIEPLRRARRTDEILDLLSRMNRWNKSPSRNVSRYVRDILLEERYRVRWLGFSEVMRREAETFTPLTPENIRDVLVRLIRIKSREERSIRGSVNILAVILPERYPEWAPRFHSYRRRILDNVRRLRELLRNYTKLREYISRIRDKIKEIEEIMTILFDIVRTGVSFYYVLTGKKGYPSGMFQISCLVDAMYSPETGIVYIHPLTLKELEACKKFFIYSWMGANKIFGEDVESTDIKGFKVPRGVTFGKDNTARVVDKPLGAVCVNIRRMNLEIWQLWGGRWVYRAVPKVDTIKRGLMLEAAGKPLSREILREREILERGQRTLEEFIGEYKSRREEELERGLEVGGIEVVNAFGRWRIRSSWEGKTGGRLWGHPFGIWSTLPPEELERLGLTFEITPEGALIYKPTPEEERKMIEDRRKTIGEW